MSYFRNLLIAIDQLGNTACAGQPRETISSRVGRNALLGKRWAKVAQTIIDFIALQVFGQADHCLKAIETVEEIG